MGLDGVAGGWNHRCTLWCKARSSALVLPVAMGSAMGSGLAAQARPLASPSPRLLLRPQGSESSRDIVMPDYTFWGHEYQYLQVGAAREGGRSTAAVTWM